MKNKIYLLLSFMLTFAFVGSIKAQDIDHDGVQDQMDNCKYTYNPNQADADNDLIGDECDCQPMVANPGGQHKPAILITASTSDTIFYNTKVNFSSVIDAGGSSPIYQWKKNGFNVGSNSSSYVDSSLQMHDTITCILVSDVVCAAGNEVLSNKLGFAVYAFELSLGGGNEILQLSVYPSPAQKEIRIQCQARILKLTLFDMNGKYPQKGSKYVVKL